VRVLLFANMLLLVLVVLLVAVVVAGRTSYIITDHPGMNGPEGANAM
jgi:hypothetical protein